MILLVLLVLLFAGLALWVRWRGGPGTPRRPQAEREAEALRARYARGEIDSAEFNARLRELDARDD